MIPVFISLRNIFDHLVDPCFYLLRVLLSVEKTLSFKKNPSGKTASESCEISVM